MRMRARTKEFIVVPKAVAVSNAGLKLIVFIYDSDEQACVLGSAGYGMSKATKEPGRSSESHT